VHVVQAKEDDEPTLFMASVAVTEPIMSQAHPTAVHLNESCLFIQLGEKGDGDDTCWILDSGATNHMTGIHGVFSEIDLRVRGIVQFGDGSVANIEGHGMILIKSKTRGHKALTGVYSIPCLTVNIVSLGQLEDASYKILLHDSLLKPWDRTGALVAKVKRAVNRLYILHLKINQPVCLAMQGVSSAWRWHVRYGHLNFRSLRHLAKDDMVSRLSAINHVEQVCDSCLAGKQRHATFPSLAKYRVRERLMLVHGDLCGPVEPAMPHGKCYLFPLVDDASRYMWLELLATKDEALAAFTSFQA
jgi:hypothetical protein